MMAEETPQEQSLNFIVVREDWSQYRLRETGSLVKVKISMSEIIDTGRKKGNLKELKFGAKNVFYKEPSPDDKGEPSQDTRILPEDVVEKYHFDRVSEPLNIYDVTDRFLILVKPVLKAMEKTKKFNSSGDRIFNYELDCSINVVGYP